MSQTVIGLISEEGEGEAELGAREAGFQWRPFRRASPFLEALTDVPDGVALVSLEGPEGGVPLATKVARRPDGGDRLLLSAPGASLELALTARELGAGLLLREPLSAADLARELRRRSRIEVGIRLPDPEELADDPELVGSGYAMAQVVRAIAEAAGVDSPVLLSGESGTGKELVARAIHGASERQSGPFVAINCAAIPEHLLESELFGHERGAFTGAVARKEGRFQRAHGGTLLLDEVGDMSLILQAKILRALEEGEVERVGGSGPVRVDARVVGATNRKLDQEVEEEAFREDLFYRLAVNRITLPPLRERLEDLEELVVHFAGHFSRRYGRPVAGVDREVLRRLRAHSWPGNVRELRNVMDRAVQRCQGGWIRPEDLSLGSAAPRLSARERAPVDGYPPTMSLEEVERDHIARVLDYTDGVMADAADILGIHRNTLTRKVNALGLRSESR